MNTAKFESFNCTCNGIQSEEQFKFIGMVREKIDKLDGSVTAELTQ